MNDIDGAGGECSGFSVPLLTLKAECQPSEIRVIQPGRKNNRGQNRSYSVFFS